MDHPFAALNDYELRNLVFHLAERGRVSDLDRLLSRELSTEEPVTEAKPRSGMQRPSRRQQSYTVTRRTMRRRHAWHTARAQQGDLAGFRSDLELVFKLMSDIGVAADTPEERGRAMGWQCRCALMIASVASTAAGVPAQLLQMLVTTGLWSPAQGLQYAAQVPDEAQRAVALARLAPHMPADVLGQALDVVRQIVHEEHRATAVVALASYLADLKHLEAALEIALSIPYGGLISSARVDALVGLTPYLPANLLPNVLAAVQSVRDQSNQVRLLMALAPWLPLPLLRRAIAIVDEPLYLFGDSEYKALVELVPQLAWRGAPEEALAAAEAIIDDQWRTLVLARIIPHLVEPDRSAMVQRVQELAQETRWIDFSVTTDRGYHPVLHHPRDGAVAMVFVRDFQPEVLSELLPYLPDDLFRQGLAKVLERWDPYYGAWLIPTMAGRLPESQQIELFRRAIETLRQQTQRTDSPVPYHRAKALREMAPDIPLSLMDLALMAARETEDVEYRARIILALVPRLPMPLVRQAIEMVQQIETRLYLRLDTLAELAPYLPEPLLHEAVAEARETSDADRRARLLAKLAPCLPDPLQGDVWEEVRVAIREITYKPAEKLAELAPLLPEPVQREALLQAEAAAFKIDDARERLRTLLRLVPYLPWSLRGIVLPEIVESANQLFPRTFRESIAATMVQREREAVLAPLLPLLAAHSYGQQALEIVQERELKDQATALASLVPHLPESTRQQMLWRSLALGQAGHRIGDWLLALGSQGSPLPAALVPRLPALIGAITDDADRARVVATLAPLLPAPALQQMLTAALAIGAPEQRAMALAALASSAGEVLSNEVSQHVQALATPDLPTAAVVRLLPCLPQPLADELLRGHLTHMSEQLEAGAQLEALRLIAPALSPALTPQALALAAAIANPAAYAYARASLAGCLPEPQRTDVAREVLAAATRDVLADPAERAHALIDVAPHLRGPAQAQAIQLVFDALQSMRKQASDDGRVESIDAIAVRLASLPVAVLYPAWSQALLVAAAQPRKHIYAMIGDLVPVIVAIGGEPATVTVFDALQQAAQWWP